MSKANTYKWVVEFEVAPSWVADGFIIDEATARSMLEDALPFAYENEFSAKVRKAPSNARLAKEQGYSSVAAYEADQTQEQ